jgi:Transcriptional regulatory protein, C terminal
MSHPGFQSTARSKIETRKPTLPRPAAPPASYHHAAFVRSRGRVLRREQLLDEVWGSGVFITDRVIDNHVMSLHRKIEDEPSAPPYLISVRGLGYRFDG